MSDTPTDPAKRMLDLDDLATLDDLLAGTLPDVTRASLQRRRESTLSRQAAHDATTTAADKMTPTELAELVAR